MKVKLGIGILVLAISLIVAIFFLMRPEESVAYETTIEQSLLEVNFTIRRSDRYNGEGVFDIKEDYSKQGIVDLYYNAGTNKQVKLVISMGRKKYTYDIVDDPLMIYFPLQLGNGKYDIEVYENVKEERYKKVYSRSVEVNVKDDRIVYLNTIQIIDWEVDDQVVELAEQLILEEQIKRFESDGETYDSQALEDLKDIEKIQIIYRYVVENIRYDFAKMGTLQDDYIPDLEDVLNEKEGICYDYSAILASMLRRLTIPTKLIKGYTTKTKVFHAWNEVYVEDENRWIVIDTTYDSYMFERLKPFKMEKLEEDYTAVYEY